MKETKTMIRLDADNLTWIGRYIDGCEIKPSVCSVANLAVRIGRKRIKVRNHRKTKNNG